MPWLWNHAVRPAVREKAPAAAVSGHGLYSTKWKGCRIISEGKNPLKELQSFALTRPPCFNYINFIVRGKRRRV